MTQETEDQGRSTPKPADRKAKLIFLAIALVAAGLIYYFLQTKEQILPGWPDDLNAARVRAKEANRRVLAVFLDNPPNNDSVKLTTFTLKKSQNRQAISDGKFSKVKVIVDSLKGKTAEKYGLKVLPTVIAFAPDGKEIARIEGRIGEMPFFYFIQDVNKKSPAAK